jgi:hypothetical protein
LIARAARGEIRFGSSASHMKAQVSSRQFIIPFRRVHVHPMVLKPSRGF